jgi:DNA-binding CsgD family transcriptional regulator
VQATAAEVHLLLGDWAAAAQRAEAEWPSPCVHDGLWPARFAVLGITASVEATLDARARREPVDVAAVGGTLRARLDDARAASQPGDGGSPGPAVVANLAEAAAQLTRLTGPDPDAWASAARRWEELHDSWAVAAARLHEAEAAVATGDAARAAVSLRAAHQAAAELGAKPLLDEIDAVARRTRIRVDAPTPEPLNQASVARLGLTPREAEVLALVAAGQTNREIGKALFVSEKTASVHVSNILRKLGVTSRVEAAAVAQRLGLA